MKYEFNRSMALELMITAVNFTLTVLVSKSHELVSQ